MPDSQDQQDASSAGSGLLEVLRYLLRWIPIASLTGVLGGTASALLLVSLVWATDTRERHKILIAFLPLAGLFVGCLYKYLGTSVEAGNNLILDEIHNPQRTIPIRMTPLILLGTVVTHLFGGSAGREGTALQTGASLADKLARPFRLGPRDRRVLLMAGLSAGFASVFGTPLAGALFGLEVLAIGTVSYEAIVPCFLAAFIGDLTTHAWKVAHTIYRVSETPPMSLKGLLCSAVAGAVFGLVGMFFARSVHALGHLFKKHIGWAPLRPFVGGIFVALAVFALGTTRYIGLGIPTILEAFGGRQPPWEWVLKLLFTVVTLGAGFKGGEVTPLFFIGATLGNAMSYLLPLPPSLLAGIGFRCRFRGRGQHSACFHIDGGRALRRRSRSVRRHCLCLRLPVLRPRRHLQVAASGPKQRLGTPRRGASEKLTRQLPGAPMRARRLQ